MVAVMQLQATAEENQWWCCLLTWRAVAVCSRHRLRWSLVCQVYVKSTSSFTCLTAQFPCSGPHTYTTLTCLVVCWRIICLEFKTKLLVEFNIEHKNDVKLECFLLQLRCRSLCNQKCYKSEQKPVVEPKRSNFLIPQFKLVCEIILTGSSCSASFKTAGEWWASGCVDSDDDAWYQSAWVGQFAWWTGCRWTVRWHSAALRSWWVYSV